MDVKCCACGKTMKEAAAYTHRGKTMCEQCCLDVRAVDGRKTHWQYIRSIKGDYLHPGKGKPSGAAESKG